ncbi:MAG: hypothetical protein EX341_09585 [Candidatus Scalindua sp. SCAELEC01]|nr:hypothetical protein [Planctomycetota bacterium]RZV82412.1 MAG: hypothetical protein EX341_09585 [Candidatus Scalindua sp. SCAELEC01]
MSKGKIHNITGLVCLSVIVGAAYMPLATSREREAGFSRPGYKPVLEVVPYDEDSGEPRDNLLYKRWCEENFTDGGRIYQAYKDIAFTIKYTPEVPDTDFWQTTFETTRMKKGDCEDVVLHFFSQLPPDHRGAAIVWGWVIDRKSGVGRAHVWYQLSDKRGKKYVVEGFSQEWNGIIPVEIVQDTEYRKPIFIISHGMAVTLSQLFPKVGDWKRCQTLVDLFASTNVTTHISGNQFFLCDITVQQFLTPDKFIEYPINSPMRSRGHNRLLDYSPGGDIGPLVDKQISDILKRLHKVFSRYESQKRETVSGVQTQDGNDSDS